MAENREAKTHQRVEYRVICLYRDATQLELKKTETLEEAINLIEKLEPNLRSMSQWLVYQVTITESLRVVYRDKSPQPNKQPFLRRVLPRIRLFRYKSKLQ